MKTAGIAIDAWKLPIFKRRLDAGGYSYTEQPGPGDTVFLKVKTDLLGPLQRVVEAATLECRGEGRA